MKMKNYIVFVLCILVAGHLHAQPFQIGYTTVTFTDSSRNNRNIPTEIYYPADIAGNNVSFTVANNDQFPVLSFGHGFVMTWDAYENIWDAVVPEGFIIAFPTTEGGLSPSHLEFGKDLAFIISTLPLLAQDSSSLFFNRVDSMNCVMGHSMGGGASFLAAQSDSRVKSIATLAPAETSPSAVQAAANLGIPVLIFAGANDCVTPPASNQIPMYDSLLSLCKTYISINGGSHCQMAENNFLCNLGEATCTPPPAITRAEQHSVVNRYLIPWLKRTLKNDCIAGDQFDSLITADTSITFNAICPPCILTSLSPESEPFAVDVFPNPVQSILNIRMFNQNQIFITDLLGKTVIHQYVSTKTQQIVSIDVSMFPPGLYIIRTNNYVNKFIKE
jgi:pimeloyl-ACP methyl ester carboxylesterase